LTRHNSQEISPCPSLPKRGHSSLWKREVRRDFTKNSLIFGSSICLLYYGPIGNFSHNGKLIRERTTTKDLVEAIKVFQEVKGSSRSKAIVDRYLKRYDKIEGSL
jgi:hypothetical protein